MVQLTSTMAKLLLPENFEGWEIIKALTRSFKWTGAYQESC